ncbi:hypothetical protein Hte_001885 [Hypoxylon texense]
MADRGYSYRGRNKANRKYSEPYGGDVWEASKDPYHEKRVQFSRQRRDSIASDLKSVATSRNSGSRVSDRTDYSGKNTQRYNDQRAGSSSAGSSNTSKECMPPPESPSEFASSCQFETDYYKAASKRLTQDEWVSPPNPRRRIRRMKRSDYRPSNRDLVVSQKRWSAASTTMYGHGVSFLRDTDIKNPVDAYRPGVVFSAPFHTSTTLDEAYVKSDDPNLTASPFGTICSKYRKLIVLNTYGEHCTVLPIYTHNGKGLDGKKFVAEFITIRDRYDRKPAPEEGLYPGIYAVRNSTFTGKFIGGRSCVKLTETCSHRYDAMATMEGMLDEVSMERLIDLFTAVNFT